MNRDKRTRRRKDGARETCNATCEYIREDTKEERLTSWSMKRPSQRDEGRETHDTAVPTSTNDAMGGDGVHVLLRWRIRLRRTCGGPIRRRFMESFVFPRVARVHVHAPFHPRASSHVLFHTSAPLASPRLAHLHVRTSATRHRPRSSRT